MLNKAKGCPWGDSSLAGKFERRGPGEDKQKYRTPNRCKYTRETLLPFLDDKRGGKLHTWIDLGHFHNRGNVLECIAELLGARVAFVGIRRNRHAIARSFVGSGYTTPCFSKGMDGDAGRYNAPEVSYCPMDGEIVKNGPVALPVDDVAWLGLNEYQKFLWMADEIEMRFHKLQKKYAACRYYEITWNDGSELMSAFNQTAQQLGCGGIEEGDMIHRKAHIEHGDKLQNCSESILMDIRYRNSMQYDAYAQDILYHRHRQHIPINECSETREEILDLLRSLGVDMDDWRVPDMDDNGT